jgi:hypothetical protein
LPLAAYARRYRDDWYGEIDIRLADNATGQEHKLEIRFSHTPVLLGELEHYQYNTFIVRWYERSNDADAFVNFQLTPEGNISQATMRAISPLTDFSFDFHDLLLRPQPAGIDRQAF